MVNEFDILDVGEVSEITNLSRDAVRALMADNIILSKKIGYNYATLRMHVNNYLEERELRKNMVNTAAIG